MSKKLVPIVAHTFVLNADTILLIRRSNTGYEDGNYGPVGGHLEEKESIKQAAVRECWEEVGITIDEADLKMIGITHYHSPSGGGIDYFLCVNKWEGEPFPKSECDHVEWFQIDRLPENTIPFVKRAIEHHLKQKNWFDEIGW